MKRVRTADELERKYNLGKLKKSMLDNTKNIEVATENVTKMQNSVEYIRDSLIINLGDILDTQSSISLYFYSGVPTTTNEPYILWENVQDEIGDFYYDRETGYVYKYTTNGWIQQTDKSLVLAMAYSNAAMDTDDNERQVFFTTPTPDYSSGDWWVLDDGTLMFCQVGRQNETDTYHENDWINSNEYANAIAMATIDELGGETTHILSGTVIEKTDKWVKFTDLATGGSTVIDGSNITTGSIDASLITTGTLNTDVITGYGNLQDKVANIENTLATGVPKVFNDILTIDGENGLVVFNENSEIVARMDNDSFSIEDIKGTTLEEITEDGAVLKNATINNYLTAGNHRIEKYTENNKDRTGWFYVGG